MPDRTHKLILDTHIWVWLMEGTPNLKTSVREALETAATKDNLFVPAISVWEVAMLESKGRITFNEDCSVWVQKALASPGTSLVPFVPDIAIASTRLPGLFHGDPADRIITATARSLEGTLVTADKAILAYAESGYVRVLAA